MSGAREVARTLSGDFFDLGGQLAEALLDALVPDIIVPSQPNVSGGEQNNTLTSRRNSSNINGRNPDIFGSTPSIPSVIMRPYRKYENGQLFEVGYYLVSRDYVDVTEMREGSTLVSSISTSSAEVYHPFNSPKSGSPVKTIGNSITDDIFTVFAPANFRSTALIAPNTIEVKLTANNATATSAGVITETSSEDAGFNQSYKIGDTVTITGMTAGGLVLDGDYPVAAVGDETITITPSGNWLSLGAGDNTITTDAVIAPVDALESAYTGWVEFTLEKVNKVWGNISAPNGLYKVDDDLIALTINTRMQAQALDDNNNPVGTVAEISGNLKGKSKDAKGITLEYDLGGLSKCRVRFARTSPFDFDFDGQTRDDIRLESIYAVQTLPSQDFGNCTTILTRREATGQAISGSNELSCIATEMLYKYENGAFASTRTNNTDAMQSLIRAARDPYIGRLEDGELDLDQIEGVAAEMNSYFTASASSIGLTISNQKETAEETFAKICAAVNCFTYRTAEGKLRVFFEKADATPRRLFTHRSKTGAETWTRRLLANGQQRDGVEVNYLNLSTQKIETYKLPEDGSATNPLKLSVQGIVGLDAAKIRANREYAKIKYSKVFCEVELFQEGRLLRRGEPVEIVKGSRIKTFDGYIRQQSGLVLTLSNDVEFQAGESYSIRLKGRDGSVESIDCFEGSDSREIILNTLPTTTEIYTGNEEEKTEFSFGSNSRHAAQLMIVGSATPQDGNVKLTAFNYDSRYYENDGAQPSRAFSDGFDEGFA